MKKEKIFYLVMTLLIALIIFLFSDISSPIGKNIGFNPATIYHLGVFFMFTFFLTLFLKKGKLDNKTITIILLSSLIYAISDEFHQLFVPGRFSTLEDVLVDIIGSTCSLILIKILEKLKRI